MIQVRTLAPGEKITENGCYALSMADYHAQPCDGPSVSSSGLRTLFSESPAHFWDESSLNPDRAPQKESEAFSIGRAAHFLLLGEKNFWEHFAVRPDKFPDFKTNAAKAWKAEQILAGKTVLEPKHLDAITGMAKSLGQRPLIQNSGLLNGMVELSLIFRDSETGLWVKSRPDVIPNHSGQFADLKTTESVLPYKIRNTVKEYRYDIQGAVVRRAARICLNIEMTDFALVFVEKKRPFAAVEHVIPMTEIDEADADLQVGLKVIKHCLSTGVWFGPGGSQSDASPVVLDQRDRERFAARREFFEREIAA